jgi:hypothetical protein
VKGKELIAIIHKRLKNMCLVSAVDEDTVSLWASHIAGAEKGQAKLSDTRRSGRAETAVTQIGFNLLMN